MIRYLPLLASCVLYQTVVDPLDSANKICLRAVGKRLWSSRPMSPLAGRNPKDFELPISKGLVSEKPFNGRVLHILTNSFPHSRGGYAVRSHELLTAQNESGIISSAITRVGYPLSIGRFPSSRIEKVGEVEYARILPRLFPWKLEKQVQLQTEAIVDQALSIDAGILHTTTPWINAVATSRAAEYLRIPWVYEVRGEPEATWAANKSNESEARLSNFYVKTRNKETEAMRAASGVVVLSETSGSDVEKRGVRNPVVVPNSISQAHLNEAIPSKQAQKALGLPEARYIGAVSSLVDYEGFDILIRSLEYLPEDIHVLLVGTGAAMSDLRSLASQLRIEDRVHFAGWQAPNLIGPWYSALEVFVMPRKKLRVAEIVTPVKGLRAQAQGIPIVCSDLPAMREVTGGEAFYAEPGNAISLAEATVQALALGRVPSDHAQRTTWNQGAADLARLYSRLSKGQ